MMKKYLKITDLNAYCIAFELSNYVWEITNKWNFFNKDTIGKQMIRAIDSISSNIAEGFGRFNQKDRIRFYHISMGSVFESVDWIKKCYVRKLINDEEYKKIMSSLQRMPLEINHLIKFTKEKLTQ